MPTMEVVARRADVMKGALHNRANFHAHERQHTSTIAPVVRGFKIDGTECGGCSGCVWGGNVGLHSNKAQDSFTIQEFGLDIAEDLGTENRLRFW